MKAVWIRRIYHILLTVALIVAAGCLIGGAVHIYRTGGDQIYTLEKINNTFRQIAIPVYIAAILTLGAFILELFLPVPKKGKPEKQYHMILSRLQQRANLDQCGDRALVQTILSLRKQRKALRILIAVILGVCTAAFLVYALNGDNYPALAASSSHEISEAMVRNAFAWGICLAIPTLLGLCTSYIIRSGMQTEIELLRHVALQKPPAKTVTANATLGVTLVRVGLCVAALVLLGLGIWGKGFEDVLTKAAAICTECVGLG